MLIMILLGIFLLIIAIKLSSHEKFIITYSQIIFMAILFIYIVFGNVI